MHIRMICTLICSALFFMCTAQSDSLAVQWALNMELGYGYVIESKEEPPPIFCFEGCTPLESTGMFESKRIGISRERKDKDIFELSAGLQVFRFERLYEDQFNGVIFGEEWDIRYLNLQATYYTALLADDKWLWSAYVGGSYAFKIKNSVSIPASVKNNMNIALGFKMDYKLNRGKAIFGRIGIAQSLRKNLEYNTDVATLKTERFTPLHLALGLKIGL